MGDTNLFDLRYPGLTDAPNGPQAVQFLAEDVDGWLTSAFPCTSGTRPTPVSNRPMIIRETDTGNWLGWNGSTWVALATGSGGGNTAVAGQWRASSSQSIPHSTDTILAFGSTDLASSVVTRATSGTGHKFTVTEAGAFAISCTCRFPDGDGSRFIELRNSGQTLRYPGASHGIGEVDGRVTLNFSTVVRLADNAELVVVANQQSGSAMNLDHVGDSIVNGFVALSIVKIAG